MSEILEQLMDITKLTEMSSITYSKCEGVKIERNLNIELINQLKTKAIYNQENQFWED